MHLTMLSFGFANSIDRAIAIPKNEHSHCIKNLRLPVGGSLYSQDSSSHINVREQQSTRSKIIYVGSKGMSVIITEQKIGNDNYCWFRVKLDKSDVTGWVRGDFLDLYLD